MAKSKSLTPRLIPMGIRQNALRKLNTFTKVEAKLVNKIASYNEELSKNSSGTIINLSYNMNIVRIRANVQKELNQLRERISSYEERLSGYNKNDEKVLRGRRLFGSK